MSYTLPNANSTTLSPPVLGDLQNTPPPGGAVYATPDTLSDLTPGFAEAFQLSTVKPKVVFQTQNPEFASTTEWTYPNSTDGKYFTATQAQIYIGNLFIDELVQLQYTFQGNRIPIFGYCSEEFDALGTGRRLVQGQLALNFVTEGYLYTVLNEFQRNNQGAGGTPTTAADQDAVKLANLITQRRALALSTATPASGATFNTTFRISMEMALLNNQIEGLAATCGASTVEAAKALLFGQGTVGAKSAITLGIPFTIRCSMTGAGRTVERILRNCVLISNEQGYDQSGQIMTDNYGFIGRSTN